MGDTMNELRMYVEHLFEGKVMTAELIELKEEIYGNLMARYEDLVASGIDAAQALEEARQSISSVDELLSGDGSQEADSSDQSGATSADEDMKGPSAPVLPQPETVTTKASTTVKAHKKLLLVLAGVLLVVIIGIPLIGVAMGAILFDNVTDGDISVNHDGTSLSAGKQGVQIQDNDDAIVVSPDGTVHIDGEPADDLLNMVVEAEPPNAYMGTSISDSSTLSALVSSLPLGEWSTQVNTSQERGILTLRYGSVPDSYDSESIDAALVYDATAIFACMPEVQQIQMSLSESDKTANVDRYDFSRAMLEEQYSQKLNGDVLNYDTWKALKTEHLYQGGFVEGILDAADRD